MQPTKGIIEPGRPGDLKMIFEVGVDAIEQIRMDHERTGEYDEAGMHAIALVIVEAIRMWRGEIPVEPDLFEKVTVN